MHASTNGFGHPVSVLFGPQCENVVEASVLIGTTLAEDSSLQFISQTLRELPSLWADITKVFPSLSQVSRDKQTIALVQHLHGSPSAFPQEPSNATLTPLTVISQILDFIKLQESTGEQNIIDTQGFCVGFLTALVAAFSKSEFQSATKTIIRLAVCIGALVDLDEIKHGKFRSIAVRWKDIAARKTFHHVIASHSNVSCSLFISNHPANKIFCSGLHILRVGYEQCDGNRPRARRRCLGQRSCQPQHISKAHFPERKIPQ